MNGKRSDPKVFGVLGVLLLALLVAGCTQSNGNGGYQGPDSGRTVIGLQDAATDMQGVTRVEMTVDEVSFHSAAQGWVTVSRTPKTYDLLQLKAESSTALIADTSLKQDTYDQMRLHVSRVVVYDASGSHDARLPSNELKFDGAVRVDTNYTSTATFDFIADESLHRTGNGSYIMAPVVHLQTRSRAQVQSTGNDRIVISGGTIHADSTVGMDLNGNIGVGIRVPINADLNSFLGVGVRIG
jgi:hypothetical protein